MQIGILLLILLGWAVGTLAAEVPVPAKSIAQATAPALPPAAPAEKAISGDELSAAAIAAVNQAADGKNGTEVKVEIVHLPPPLKVSGEYTVVADSPGNVIQPGVRAIHLQIMRGSRVLATTDVNVRIRVFQPMPVAVGSAQANSTLSSADVEWQTREVKPNVGRMVDPNTLSSLRLKIAVNAGQPLEERLFSLLPVIRKGDRVLITISRGQLTISTNAEALGEAALGQNVRVRFLDTGAELFVKAIGPSQAEM